MIREEIMNQLKEISAAQVKVPIEEIREELLIFSQLGLDSLSIADMIIRVEEYFGFDFQEEDLLRLKTVGDQGYLVGEINSMPGCLHIVHEGKSNLQRMLEAIYRTVVKYTGHGC